MNRCQYINPDDSDCGEPATVKHNGQWLCEAHYQETLKVEDMEGGPVTWKRSWE